MSDYHGYDYHNLPRQLTRGVIAIDGYSGAGKSVLARLIADEYIAHHHRINIIHTDWFATWDNPFGWWEAMVSEVIKPLRRGEAVWFSPLVWKDGKVEPDQKQYLERSRVIILEGVSCARRSMTSYIDCAIWVDGGTSQECLERAIARDGEEHRKELTIWKDFERGWFAVDNTRQRCHIVTMK